MAKPGGATSVEFDTFHRRRSSLAFIARLDRRSLPASHAWDWHAGTFAGEGEPAELAQCLETPARHRQALILDLGCGEGCMGRSLARAMRRQILGIDFSAAALDLAVARRVSGQTFVLADLHHLPFKSGAACAAFSWDALYLLTGRAKALREFARLLKRGAPLVFTDYVPATQLANARRCWSALLRRTGFRLQVWSDRTDEWRQFMDDKHARRLAHEARILKAHGALAMPDLAVSRAMLGRDGGVPFLLRHRRVWIRAERR